MTIRYLRLTDLIPIGRPRPKECRTCEFSREKTASKGVKILRCVYENPQADPEGRAVWPIVEPDDSCKRHKYDSRR